MNFYLDFEATQYTQEIISIGCAAENGTTFRQLVQPHNYDGVTSFITELTGLTPELLENEGCEVDEAFLRFKNFVQKQSNEVPTYFCYGNSDKGFITHTMQYMKDFEATTFAASVVGLLSDYSKTVKKYLSVQGVALQKLVMLVRHSEDVTQNHDALDDALMLRECYGKLDTISTNSQETLNILHKKLPKPKKHGDPIVFKDTLGRLQDMSLVIRAVTPEMREHLAEMRRLWGTMDKRDIHGDVEEENAEVKLTHVYSGEVKYFSAPIVAATYLNFKEKAPAPSSTNISRLQRTVSDMFKSPNNYCKYRIELVRKEEN